VIALFGEEEEIRESLATTGYRAKYPYNVALSFAGEDRALAEALAAKLKAAGLGVFYDDYETARLWGKDLFETLYSVYSKEARY
jgi:hypothetical protein